MRARIAHLRSADVVICDLFQRSWIRKPRKSLRNHWQEGLAVLRCGTATDNGFGNPLRTQFGTGLNC